MARLLKAPIIGFGGADPGSMRELIEELFAKGTLKAQPIHFKKVNTRKKKSAENETSAYTDDEEEVIKRRLEDLGYI